VGDVGFEGTLAIGGSPEEPVVVELVVIDAVRALYLALEMGLADGREFAGDAFFAQLALEDVLDADVGEHGESELGAVVRLDLDAKVSGFIDYYNAKAAHPYRWTYTGQPRAV
jgi:hypothetical protein